MVKLWAKKKGFLDVSEARAVTERHCGVSIVHMANSQTGGWPPSLPCHALAGASVDTVLANLILIVRSKEWWLSPHLWDHQVHFCGCIGIFFSSPRPPSLDCPLLPFSTALEQYSAVPWASQSELTGVNLSGLFSLLLPLSRSHSLPLFLFKKPSQNSVN